MKKKLLSIFLVLAMALTILPLSVLAASWTVTLGGTEYTLTEEENGSISSEPSGNNYYTFSKVTDGEADNLFYYSFNSVQLGTIEGIPVTEASVEDDTITVEATVEEGKAEVNFEVSDSDLNGLSADETGTITIEASGIEAQNVSTVEVRLPENLVTAVQADSSITSVKIEVTIATVTLPAADLSASDHLTVTTISSSGTVLGGVSLTMGEGQFTAPVEVTINVSVTVENPVIAYLNQGRYFRVRQSAPSEGSFTFFTRHFSDFVVVDGDSAALEAIEMEDAGSGRNHSYAIEADEALVAAVKASDGSLNYMSVGPVADKMGSDTVNARLNAPETEIGNVCAIIGEMKTNADGTPNITDADTIRVDPAFGEIL